MPIDFWLDTLYALVLLLIALKFKIGVVFRDFAERHSSRFVVQALLFLFPSLLLWTLLRLLFQITTDSLLFARSISSEIQSARPYAKHLASLVDLMVDWFVCYAILDGAREALGSGSGYFTKLRCWHLRSVWPQCRFIFPRSTPR